MADEPTGFLPDLTPELLDQATFLGALILMMLAAVVRKWRKGSFFNVEKMGIDLLNSAAVVPLLTFIGGLFYPALRMAISEANSLLIVLACSVALFFVLRSLFKPDAD